MAQPVRARRLILHTHRISFQRARTWTESRDPDRDAELARIEYVISHYLDRCFAFDQFGPAGDRVLHDVLGILREGEHPVAVGQEFAAVGLG